MHYSPSCQEYHSPGCPDDPLPAQPLLWPTPSQASSLYLYVYHNSFGSCYATTTWGGHPYLRGGIPNAQFINNVFSNNSWLNWIGYTNDKKPWATDPLMIKVFSYNWMGDVVGQGTLAKPPVWMDDTNIKHQGEEIWSATEEPDWLLPLTSDALQAGIDLSVPYIINKVIYPGKINKFPYPALPGMKAGYYSGSAPNMGAKQDVGGKIKGSGVVSG
jgi:hypothetical protein